MPKVELPFSSKRKMMVTVHKIPSDGRFEAVQFHSSCKYVAIVKGAPDVLLPRLSGVLTWNSDGNFHVDDKEMGSADNKWFQDQNEAMSNSALRVLCVALRPLSEADFDLVLKAESDADERANLLLKAPLV